METNTEPIAEPTTTGPESPGYLEIADMPYVPDPMNERQCVDLYLPVGKGPFPLALWIHGGGWNSCNRKVNGVAGLITGKGFALASVGYRLIGEGFPFPAQFDDCIAGLNWLVRYADEYALDMEKIGVFGHSAGGHLASLLMLTSRGQASFPGLPVPAVKISAGAFWSSVFDLSRKRGFWPEGSKEWGDDSTFCRYFFPKGIYDENFARQASPASYLRGDVQSDMLIVHGDRDELVPFQQASLFAEEARKAGVQVAFQAASGGHDMLPEIWNETLEYFQRVFSLEKRNELNREKWAIDEGLLVSERTEGVVV